MTVIMIALLGMLAIEDCHNNKFLSDATYTFAVKRMEAKFHPTEEDMARAIMAFNTVTRPSKEQCKYFENVLLEKMDGA